MKRTKTRYRFEFLKSTPQVLRYKFFKIKPRTDTIGGFKKFSLEDGHNLIKRAIFNKEPFAAIRFGAVELSALNNFEKRRLKIRRNYKKAVRYSIKNNAGFFPVTDEFLDHYGKLLESTLVDTDAVGISGLHMENYYFHTFTPNALPLQNWALDPLLGGWSYLLKGKKVLVVSPFAEEILEQYAKRELLFPTESNILPEFTLSTVKAVQTVGDEVDERFANWFEALDYLKLEILKEDFDIALIGAGAYGTPLCLFVKSLGKMAIQSGGATQLLFGIIGKRWEKREYVAKHINENWIRPKVKAKGFENVEGGCYW